MYPKENDKLTCGSKALFRNICLGLIMCLVCSRALVAQEVEALRFDFSPSFLEEVKARAEAKRKKILVPFLPSFSQALWQNSAVLDGLYMPDGSRTELASTVLMAHDAANIYMAVDNVVPSGKALPPLAVSPAKGNKQVWEGDHLELWFTTPAGKKYQFVVSANGDVYDLGKGDSGYTPGWKHVVTRMADGWRAELTFPLGALELSEWPKELPCNIGRNGPFVSTASWSGNYGDTSLSSLILDGAEDKPLIPSAQEAVASDILTAGVGGSLQTELLRSYARPGERWINIGLNLPLFDTGGAGYQLEASIFALNKNEPVASLTIVPPRSKGKAVVDLRALQLSAARLRLHLLENNRSLASREFFLTAQAPKTVLQLGEKIKVLLDEPAGIQAPGLWPVTFGVPLPAGALWDLSWLGLEDELGRPLPCQIEPMALWAPDGAVKWARVDALVNVQDGCYVSIGGSRQDHPDPALSLQEENGQIVVNTGPATYLLGKGKSPVIEIRQGTCLLADTHATRGLYVIDQAGRLGTAAAEEEIVTIEARGPVASCVKFEGYYKTEAGENLARHITRVENFAGQASAKITHTLVLSENTTNLWLKDIGWEFSVAPGTGAEALFGTSHSDPLAVETVPLAGDSSAYMFQDSHYCFAHGDNHFSIAAVRSDGVEQLLLEGEECGEFAGVRGTSGGLLIGCRDAALQHPKEFEVTENKIILRLFSNRAGEELDFRTQTLVEKWDLENWYANALSHNYRKEAANYTEKALSIHSDAIGWAKTHDLFISPLAPATEAAVAASLAALHNRQVFALIDPEWSCKSDVFGPLHPKDSDNFALAEDYLDSVFRLWEKRIAEFGDYGFMFYYAGPHLGYNGKYARTYRYANLLSYTLRPDIWTAYVRSGERQLREFSEKSNQTFGDCLINHWQGMGKIPGLFLAASGSDNAPWLAYNLPFHWVGSPDMDLSSSSDLNNFLYYYYLTGARRAKDFVTGYAEGVKQLWTFEKARRSWRGIMLTRMIAQAYSLTWDPALLEMAEATADAFYDEEGALKLSKDRPYRSSSYKTRVDMLGLRDAWDIIGNPRYYDLMKMVGNFWWGDTLGKAPVFYVNNQGLIGNFLYRETGNPAMPEMLALQMRQAVSSHSLGDERSSYGLGAETTTFIFQGIPYAMELMRRANLKDQSVASWVAYEDFGYPVSIILRKSDYGVLNVDLRTEGKAEDLDGVGSAGGVGVRPVAAATTSGMDLNYITQRSAGVVSINIPKDAPEGAYEILTPAGGFNIAVADSLVPMVIYAPEYWRPAPPQKPGVPWFFNVPADAVDAQIFIEQPARLFDPDGQPWGEGLVSLWINLPADKPGLWRFEPAPDEGSVGLVRVKNLPPFFAARDPRNYFEPVIAWQQTSGHQPPEQLPAGSVYVEGVTGRSEDQALYLDKSRRFVLQDREFKGKNILPFEQGTVEFFFKPSWSIFDIPADGSKRLLTLNVVDGEPWYISYMKSTKVTQWLSSHVLYGRFMTDGPSRRISMTTWRQSILESGEWVHLAWVWGPYDTPDFTKKEPLKSITARIYLNGRRGKQYSYGGKQWADHRAVDQPKELVLGPGVLAAYDDLRLSDYRRYERDFMPPEGGLSVDEHTLALFRFDGTVEGEVYGSAEPVVAELR